jgi:hypothetical protein
VAVADPPSRQPLNDQTIWQQVLDDGAIERILKRVDLSLREGVSPQAFASQLNFHLSDALARSISTRPRQARAAIKQLRQGFETYFGAQHKLRELGFDFPDPPASWRDPIEARMRELEDSLEGPSRGGRYTEVMTRFVVPGLLGLFEAAFGQRPTSTTSRQGGLGGPAARFIEAVIEEVRHSIEGITFDPTLYGKNRQAKLTQQWTVRNPTQLERMIGRGLRQLRPAEEFDPTTGIGPLPERLE